MQFGIFKKILILITKDLLAFEQAHISIVLHM